jgi:cytochrome c peroxidase
MKLTTIALAVAFALSSTFALAKTVRHKPGVRTFDLRRGVSLGSSGLSHPNYRNPDGATGVSAGGYMWNGRSASEWGGG